ncbi:MULTISPECIES: acetyl-CoA hydrolase/transferase C-terminal domain-containing protein [unclassified Pseudoxanthomonas]|uniref:acetyl-CoA hydrolase/transferase C-terminal domain-containing protein n=1 Tax=unclassified Pseudoxanthomonas TaxID=2645906 RepID=UPI0008EF64BC|nr:MULTISPECIES: acetyl-CoA hydrolase/transferase C-terminal domain-containing protein [unclassified Pseudoxanthomonas]PPJ43259.1 acetyl-CoA hydrolase [Pseudoxanthomonas sp. KAs_5_3]SFV34626.1 Acyl-CoA hydrolase [Pseudoxanthomonas sp. YR558]
MTPRHLTDLDEAVDLLLAHTYGPLRMGAPLGIGKPHRLLNALYRRGVKDPSRPWSLYTALSLDPPMGGKGLEGRFVTPFATRHFGDDFPRLDYVQAMKRDALPAHMEVEEFYMQGGALLRSTTAQRLYASLNYTHVARALADRALNVIVQKVAREPGGTRLSFSCNNDLTQDAVDAIVARGLPRPLLVAEVDPQLPWIGGTAAVDEAYFDIVITPPGPYPHLFGLPRQPVSDAEYAIGLYASALVRDGGTLQIGIGALADALCHALVLRHTDNATYRRILAALDPALEQHPAVLASGGLDPFALGLYGCSEMVNEGFKRLVETGVIRRKVVDDEALMRRIADGTANLGDQARLERDGEYLHGAFYLGSPAFYQWLRDLPDDQRRAIGMRRISLINELQRDHEPLARLQRHDARFFNSCMMVTALGAAVSDGLEDGRVVSGVGGQYNFVDMSNSLDNARSALMFRAVRDDAGAPASNVRWNYGHTTIPRHLRDLYVNEYGIADLRGKNDEDCVIAMGGITDARFQSALVERAKREGKLRSGFHAPGHWIDNTPVHLSARLRAFRHDGTLPDYPLGSDFTEVEQRIVKALGWLKANTATPWKKIATVAKALAARPDDEAAMARMALAQPATLGERLEAKLLALGLRETR